MTTGAGQRTEGSKPTADPPRRDSARTLLVTTYFSHHGLPFFEAMLQALRTNPEVAQGLVEGKATAPATRRFRQDELLGRSSVSARAPSVDENIEGVLLVPHLGGGVGHGLVSTRWGDFARPDTLGQLVKDGVLEDRVRQHALQADPPWERTHLGASELDLDRALPLPRDVDAHALWPLIKEAPLGQQVHWLKEHNLWRSSARAEPFRIEQIELESSATRDPRAWARALGSWLAQHGDCRLIVNLGGIPSEALVAWYYLGWQRPDLQRAQFVDFRTPRRSDTDPRFRDIEVHLLSRDLLRDLSRDADTTIGLVGEQTDAARRLESFKKYGDGFVIVMLGERGTGKSRAVHQVFGHGSGEFVELNCAEFGTDLNLARSLLFGHKKGAFTGAVKDVPGAFRKAHGGTLYLDEIHHLSKSMQAMLLLALQTNEKGEFRFRQLGSTKTETSRFQLIVASNADDAVLRTELLPDFWDRIHQRTVRLPPVAKGDERVAAWNAVWMHLKLTMVVNPMAESCECRCRFAEWLDTLELPGNFRDLERVAILTADLQRAAHAGDEKLRKSYFPIGNDPQDPWWFRAEALLQRNRGPRKGSTQLLARYPSVGFRCVMRTSKISTGSSPHASGGSHVRWS